MSQSRLQNSLSNEQEQESIQQSQQSQQNPLSPNRVVSRPPGRPRGRGRPKLTQRAINKKKVSQQQFEEELPKTKERANAVRQQNQIEAYVRIVDYLKKIQCDQASFQNKMNPFHSLTAICFWYMVSAEYYSYDFFWRNHPLDAANHVLNRVSKLPIPMPTRFIKNNHQGMPLEFQTQQVKKLGEDLSQYLNHLIPSPLSNAKGENIQKKLSLSTVLEDNQFVSSTRAILFNYIKGKIEKSQKWSSLKGKLQDINGLESKQIIKRGLIFFQQIRQEIVDASQLDILSRQVKKKKSQMRKGQKGSEPILQNNVESDEKMQNEASQNAKSLAQNIEQNIQLQQNSMQQQKNSEQKKQSCQLSLKKDESEGQSVSQNQNIKKFFKEMTSDEVLLSGILNLPLEKVISILESTLPKVQLPQIYPTFMPIPKSDPLEFVFQLHQEQQNYLEYMKQYQKKQYHSKIKKSQNIIEEQERQTQFQDAKCQICTDGDYTDDNLIVFCSTCNISLHQRCVGLAKVPAESWVCDVCAAFGPAGINVPCPLCNVKGGAMKRTSIHIDSNIFKQGNPGYYQYSKKCPYTKQKQQYVHVPKVPHQNHEHHQHQEHHHEQHENPQNPQNHNNPQNHQSHHSINQNHEQSSLQSRQQLYYDYFNKKTYPNDQPVCHYVWVHYVCSIWVPQCYFQQKNGAINVKGIQNIQKKRYKHQCYSCKKVKAGACVKCQDPECKKYYHPECARKKKVYMEQLNLQKIKYLIFCQQHQPLKITRQIEYKKKKNRDQIIKFARMIEKYIETYKIAHFPFKLMKIIPTKSFIQTFECQQKEEEPEKKPEVIKQTDQDYIKQLILKLSKVKKISVTIIRTETGLKISDIYQPSRRQTRKCLNKYDDFWHTIENGQTAEENCKRYDKIMKQNLFLKDKMEIFLNGGYLGGSGKPTVVSNQKNKKGRARGRSAKQPVQTLIQQEGGIFCICRKPYQNQLDMLECQICGEWYHFKCIGFIGNQVDAQTLQFHCMKCMKFQSQEQKRPRLEKCIHFFSPDSLYLNYSPPTPKLMSQEDEHEIKQPFQLQENNALQIPQIDIKDEKKQMKQNKQLNIQHISQQNQKQSQIQLPSVVLKSRIKSSKSQRSQNSLKQVQKAQKLQKAQKVQKVQKVQKGKKIQSNNTQSNIKSIQTNQSADKPQLKKMQTTITKFFNNNSKKQQQPSLSQNNQNTNIKQKITQLERSVINGEYNNHADKDKK